MRGAPPGAPVGRALYASALVIATCGLIYELVAGAMGSYLIGNSVTQFSLVIGTYLSAMGVGSYLSKFIERRLIERFVEIEIAVALIGGFEAPLLFAAFTWTPYFQTTLFGLVFVIGLLVGLEIPLLIRVLETKDSLKDLVARVLFLDYIGALLASLLFPLVLVPQLGLFRSSLAFGIVNAAVGLWTTFLFEAPPAVLWRLRAMAVAAIAALTLGLAGASRTEAAMEARLFADPLVYREATAYQRLAITHADGDLRLFLDGALQFSTVDEYRYHEALVHPAMANAARRERVLVLGGGDGLAVREVFRWEGVREVVLVDLDPAMTELFRERDDLAALNDEALRDPRVTIVNDDAFSWLQADTGAPFDVAIIDFPDPNHFALGKLYTVHFYRLLKRALAADAAIAVQSTSPLFSPNAFWCVAETIRHEGFTVRPYHAYVPSFGEWGFQLAFLGQERAPTPLPEGLRFLDAHTMAALFHFPKDMVRTNAPVNRLDNQVLVRLYEEDWRRMVQR